MTRVTVINESGAEQVGWPPPRCLKCNALDQAGTPGAMRSTCLLRQPMHEECAWFQMRRLTAKERMQ